MDIVLSHIQQRVAQEVLTTLKEHPDAWTRVDTILEFSQNLQTKYYALQILETVIRARWKVLPRQQCEGQSVLLFYCFFLLSVVTVHQNTINDLSFTVCRKVILVI